MDKAIIMDPERAPVPGISAAIKAPPPPQKQIGKYTEDCWRKLSGVNAVFSDQDLTLTNTTNTTQTTVSKIGIPLGAVRYWQIKVNNSSCDACGMGVVHETKIGDIANTHADSSNCWKWESVGRFYENGNRIDATERFRTGDNVGLLCDRRPGHHTLTIFKNGAEHKVLRNLPENECMLFPALTPCCTNDSFTTDFAAAPPASVNIPELMPTPPPPPPPTVDVSLYPKDTWKEVEGLDMEFSNNNLTVTNPGKKTQCTTSLYGIPAGVSRYWAIVVEATSCSACGIAVTLDTAQTGIGSYADKAGCWKWEKIGRFFANGVLVSQSTGFVEGDILGVFVDRAPNRGTVTFFKNGEEVCALQGIPEDPAVLAYPTVVPCCNGASFTGLFNLPPPPEVKKQQQEAAAAEAAATTTTSTSGLGSLF